MGVDFRGVPGAMPPAEPFFRFYSLKRYFQPSGDSKSVCEVKILTSYTAVTKCTLSFPNLTISHLVEVKQLRIK